MNPLSIRYRRDLWQLLMVQVAKLRRVEHGNLGGAAEVGVAEGNFAEEILRWPIRFPTVYLVDRWKSMKGDSAKPQSWHVANRDSAKPQSWHDANRIKATARVAQFGSRARILQMASVFASEMISDSSLSFVNIDADHSYEGVKTDIEVWWPKLKTGGLIAFHDHENPAYGVKRAVREFADANELTVYNLPEDKEEDAGAFLLRC